MAIVATPAMDLILGKNFKDGPEHFNRNMTTSTFGDGSCGHNSCCMCHIMIRVDVVKMRTIIPSPPLLFFFHIKSCHNFIKRKVSKPQKFTGSQKKLMWNGCGQDIGSQQECVQLFNNTIIVLESINSFHMNNRSLNFTNKIIKRYYISRERRSLQSGCTWSSNHFSIYLISFSWTALSTLPGTLSTFVITKSLKITLRRLTTRLLNSSTI